MMQLTSVQYYLRARNLYKIGQYQAALYDYNKAISLEPENLKYYSNRDHTYSKLSQYNEAIQDYNLAIK